MTDKTTTTTSENIHRTPALDKMGLARCRKENKLFSWRKGGSCKVAARVSRTHPPHPRPHQHRPKRGRKAAAPVTPITEAKPKRADRVRARRRRKREGRCAAFIPACGHEARRARPHPSPGTSTGRIAAREPSVTTSSRNVMRVMTYARVSTKTQRDRGVSLDDQETRFGVFLARTDAIRVQAYAEAKSAGTVLQRKTFLRMFEEL